jgi:ESS family glutamate:Na+ symporter
MELISLDPYQSAGVGAAVLVLGLFLVSRSKFLKRYCIPAAVIGGFLFSIFSFILYSANVIEISFTDTVKDISMMVFFCSVGFLASFAMLRSGGKIVVILICLMFLLISLQDALGIGCATACGLDPKYGLALGSISLTGGHGTAAAYGEILVNDFGLTGADVVAVASATFGLMIAGFMGGPLAKRLVVKYDLKPKAEDIEEEVDTEGFTDKYRFLHGMIVILICIGLGTIINMLLKSANITIPAYFGGMIMAFIVRNIAEYKKFELPLKEIEMIGWIGLSMFLSMALMAMKLWQLADLALPMVLTLVLQTVLLVLFVYFLVFRLTGKNYESAALCAGVTGFGMGATPNAVANMQALTDQYGPAPMAYFVIPLMGGVFLDIINAGVLTTLLNIL